MKRKYLILPISILALILVFTLLPVSFISANPGNLVNNGDFSTSYADDWKGGGDYSIDNVGDNPPALRLGPQHGSYFIQYHISTSNKNLIFSCYTMPIDTSGSIIMGFEPLKNGLQVGPPTFADKYFTPDINKWTKLSSSLSSMWKSLHGSEIPDFDEIGVWVQVVGGTIAYFDNIRLEAPGGGGEAEEEEIWVRNHEMQCWQVWINQDNAFEFVFVWEYYNNNHVQIFDMAGNLVFATDMQKGNARFVAALPDGMYMVKTFHEAGHILQEFVIGKP